MEEPAFESYRRKMEKGLGKKHTGRSISGGSGQQGRFWGKGELK